MFHPLPPATKYASNDGRRATDGRSSLSTDPMANGFSLNETACLQIFAEGRTVRHFRNSLALTQPFSVHRAASFPQHRATDRTGDELNGTRMERYAPYGCYRYLVSTTV
jgi:hypothetical protein